MNYLSHKNWGTFAIVFFTTCATHLFSQVSFNYSSLLLYRVGDGASALSASATQVSILEYSTSGTLLQTINMPTSGPDRLTASGNQTTQGKLRYDGEYLAVPGFDAAVGTANLISTTSVAVPRRVSVLHNNLLGTTQTANVGTAYSGNNIRGATPRADGTGFWVAGQGSTAGNRGIWYHDFSLATNTQVNNLNQSRSVVNYGGQLYAGRTTTGNIVQSIGTGQPISPAPNANLPGSPEGRSIAFAETPGGTVLYTTQDNTTLRKYSLVGGNWVFDGLSAASGAGSFLDLTTMVDGSGNVQIFAVTGTRLLAFTDTSGFNSPWSAGGWTTLAIAGSNYAFRGITQVPEPTLITFLALMFGILILLKNRHKKSATTLPLSHIRST